MQNKKLKHTMAELLFKQKLNETICVIFVCKCKIKEYLGLNRDSDHEHRVYRLCNLI